MSSCPWCSSPVYLVSVEDHPQEPPWFVDPTPIHTPGPGDTLIAARTVTVTRGPSRRYGYRITRGTAAPAYGYTVYADHRPLCETVGARPSSPTAAARTDVRGPMTGHTPLRNLPYAQPADPLNIWPATSQELATALDAAIGPDTGWVNGGTGATIFVIDPVQGTLTGSQVRRVGRIVFLNLEITIKIAFPNGSHGNMSNVVLGQLVAAYRPDQTTPYPSGLEQGLGSDNSGRFVQYTVSGGGSIKMCATGSTTNFVVGEAIGVSGSFVI